MVGQKTLRDFFTKTYIEGNKPLPRSAMLIGTKGSGRKTFVKWLSDSTGISVIQIGQKADDIRNLSEMCYRIVEPMIYLIPDVEQMSATAQNALLKILEEPPNNSIMVVTVAQENVVLPTIVSRCVKFYMDNYSDSDLLQYAKDTYGITEEEQEVMLHICVCPGDIDLLCRQNIKEFKKYVKVVFENIATVSGANSFKIGEKINLSDDSTKFDLSLFWRAFVNECFNQIEDDQKYLSGVTITQRYLQDLRIKGINRQMSFDNWILDIRQEWL